MKAVKIVPVGLFLLLFSYTSTFSQTLLSGFQSAEFSSGWALPMGVLFNKTGSQAFVWEKAGKVHFFSWNAGSSSYIRQTTPLLDISPEVGNWGDHGLMSIALDPSFEINGYIYLLYVVDRHHLLNFGKAGYSSTANEYYNATIGRVTRYKVVTNGMNELVIDPASRKILIGESKSTGMAITHDSHGCGSLVFASDSSLLISMGDGASYAAGLDSGYNTTSYWQQAIADSIIRPQENVGAFRAQMVNCHNGKILRIDPSTGDGIPSNPFYLAGNPRAARSRVWAMGLRNTFRFTVRPNTGASQRTIGDIGQIYAGEVGNGDYEELNMIDGPGYNCGWPIFEGILSRGNYDVVKNLPNKDEPNPLFGTGGCTQQYFTFQNLLKQATADNNTAVYNPCNTSQAITGTIGSRYFHRVPLLDWDHWNNNARVKVFSGNLIGAANIGTSQSGVTGTPFKGNSSSGGCWYQGNLFPSNYKNTFLMADYGSNWIKQLTIDASGRLTRVDDFASGFQGIIQVVENPLDGSLFCVDIITQKIYRISYGGNKPPVAKIVSDKNYSSGSSLTVNFTGSNSYDPEGGALSYTWNFGDGTANSTLSNPSHTFSTGTNTSPRKYVAVLTVRDNQNSTSTDSIIISLNNTPPSVKILSPVNNAQYAPTGTDTTYLLQANVTDAEQGASQLLYQWQTFLRHNTHEHPGAIDTNKITSAVISRVGCNGDVFHWLIRLTVTDAAGLTTVDSSKIFPSCVTSPPGILIHPQSQSVCEGVGVTFSSAVSDNPPPLVQWQVSTNSGSTWSNITGATSSSYTFTPVAADNGKRFRAVWTNNIGPTYSNAASLTINSQPAAPTGLSFQTFCFSASVSDLSATGTSVNWYSASMGGTALSGTTSLVNGAHYYASQTVSGCESGNRLDVTVSVSPTSNPTVFLDGSGSSGPISSYQWSMVSGPNSPVFSSPAAATTNVSGLAPGMYVFRLSLNSGASTSQVLVNVNPADTPLVAHAGYDRSVALPASSITLNGSGSKGAITSYAWSRVSGPNVPTIATPASVSTSVSGLVQGIYSFELAVKDAQNITRRDTVAVTVTTSSGSGTAPVISATHTASSSTGTTVNTISGAASGSLLALSVSQVERTSTLFTASQAIQPPTADASNDGLALELGMRFRSSEDGYITGIRFYKAVNNTGTHTGELYSSTGTRLAQAVFTGETASGWQQVNFSTPVFITKGTTYIAAYHSSAGFFSRYTNYFQNSIVEGPLTGLADGIDGSNGLFIYSNTPAFPTSTYAKTNYWVDVVFARAHATVSSTPSLVWTRRADAQGIASSGNAELYTAQYAAGGNISITTSWGSGSLSTTAYSISNYDTSLAGASATATGQSAPSVTVTSSRSNSLLLAVSSDRNGVSGTSRAYRDGATETYYTTTSGVHSAYHYRKASTAAGSYLEGLTAPTGMSAGTALWEVMGPPGPPPEPIADAGYNQTLLAALAPTGQGVQSFYGTATVAELKATGSNLRWYAAASGGTPLASTTLLDSNKHYYASQTVNNCESIQRLDVLVLVKPVPGDLAVTATATDALCYLDSSGTITASGSGGIPPYTYRLNAGSYQLSGLFTRLKADTSYTVYVRDSMGGIASVKLPIRHPALLSINTTLENATCTSGGTILIHASGGVPGYQYALNNGTYQRSNLFSNLVEGSYSVTVKDTNGCLKTVNVSILAPNAPEASVRSQTNVSCKGSTNGTVTVTARGGTGPYLFSQDGIGFSLDSTFNNLKKGVYKFTVKDASGCTDSVSASITEPDTLNGIILSQINVNCNGNGNGSVTVSATGGKSPYRYSMDGTLYTSNGTFNDLSTGNYTILIKDSNNCTAAISVQITEPAELTASMLSKTNVDCKGRNSGSATVSALGGTTPYLYSKDGTNFSSSATFNNLTAGVYTITVKDAKNCQTTVQFTISEPELLITSIRSQNNIDCIDNGKGSVSLTANGGLPPYLYSMDGINFVQDSIFGNLNPGTYSARVKDVQNCLSATLNVTIQNTSSATVHLKSIASGAVTSYAWSTMEGPNVPVIDSPGRPNTYVRGLVKGSYIFELSVNGGISRSRVQVNVSSTSLPVKAHAGFDRVLYLPTDSILLDGNGSTGNITGYLWSLLSGPGNIPTLTSTSESAPVARGLNAGVYVYRLQVKDISGNFVSSDTVSFTVHPTPATPPVIALVNSRSNNTTNTVTNSLSGVPPNALLVLTIAQANDFSMGASATVSSSPALAWTKRADANAAGSGNAEIWTAVFTGGGKISVSSALGQSKRPISAVLYAITGYNALNSFGNKAEAISQTGISVPITATQFNSLLLSVSSDLKAVSGTVRSYRDSATETQYHTKSAVYTAYHYRRAGGSRMNFTLGLMSPSVNMSAGTAILEVKGAPSTPVTAYAGVNQSVECGNVTLLITGENNMQPTIAPLHATTKKEKIREIKIFPNPGKGLFQIIGTRAGAGTIKVYITDARGNMISTQSIKQAQNDFQISVDLSFRSNGLYFVYIYDGNKMHIKKFVKL